jgi:hypothetical protein
MFNRVVRIVQPYVGIGRQREHFRNIIVHFVRAQTYFGSSMRFNLLNKESSVGLNEVQIKFL